MLFGCERQQSLFVKLAAEDALGHAYLFFGDAHVGKSAFARHLAFFLELGAFEIDIQTLLDHMWLPRVVSEPIGVDAVRELKKFVWKTPLRSKKRFAVVDDAHRMTPEAQSAALKVVEEPPPHGLFVFITHDEAALIPPLVSRLQKIYFPRRSRAEIELLLKDCFGVPSEQARRTAQISFGCLGYALAQAGLAGPLRRNPPTDGEASKREDIQNELRNGTDGEKGELVRLLDERIAALRERSALTHSAIIAELLDLEMDVKRYNVNPNLQRKVAEYLSAAQ